MRKEEKKDEREMGVFISITYDTEMRQSTLVRLQSLHGFSVMSQGYSGFLISNMTRLFRLMM